MQMLIPKLAQADIWVFASPVYVDGITGPMKNLIDRMIPLMDSFMELQDGHCRKYPREGVKRGKAVLVSSCGFWEMDNFDPLIVHMKAICMNFAREFSGALLRPHAPVLMKAVEGGRENANNILEAVKEAGCQLVKDGAMATETLNIVSSDLLPIEKYIQASNRGYQQAVESLNKTNGGH
jgi:multimeric flavodoxin WrbA